MSSKRTRLDVAMVERGLVETRARAQGMIMAGSVLVQGARVDKPGAQVSEDTEIRIAGERPKYVSRGGETSLPARSRTSRRTA